MKKTQDVLYWLPRILCVLAILFVSMFALDAFEGDASIGQKLGAFLIHLVPSYVLIALLIVAWKWEKIGGIIFTLVGIGFSPLIFLLNLNRNHFSVGQSLLIVLMITFPFIVVGILFIVSDYLKKKSLTKS